MQVQNTEQTQNGKLYILVENNLERQEKTTLQNLKNETREATNIVDVCLAYVGPYTQNDLRYK